MNIYYLDYNFMNIRIFIFISLCIISTYSLYTQSQFTAKYSKLHHQYKNFIPKINISTTCNAVNLAVYNYSGIVRSGYLSVNKGNSVLGFIFYGRSDIIDTKLLNNYPTIIWLNGGPGSSSQLGNFNQLGPLWVIRNPLGSSLKVIKNNFAWTNQYNVLFIDQPVGTGISYADPEFDNAYVHNMNDVAKDFYVALDNLYNNPNGCFSKNQLNILPSSNLYIIGQSYAGKYVPAIAAQIKKNLDNGGFLTGLKGIGIGDGFTSPYDILSQVGNFAYHLGLIDYQQRIVVEQLLISATINLEIRNYDELHNSFDDIIDYIIQKAGNVNVYDITKYGDYDDTVSQYLHMLSTLNLFNLNPEIRFGLQSDQVYFNLYNDFMKPEVQSVEYLLNKNFPILIYNGQNDLIVESPGTMKWVQKINFPNAEEFQNALLVNWKINDKVVGSVKKAGALEFRIVNNAGHLVPMDQPANSLNMVKNFIERTK